MNIDCEYSKRNQKSNSEAHTHTRPSTTCSSVIEKKFKKKRNLKFRGNLFTKYILVSRFDFSTRSSNEIHLLNFIFFYFSIIQDNIFFYFDFVCLSFKGENSCTLASSKIFIRGKFNLK